MCASALKNIVKAFAAKELRGSGVGFGSKDWLVEPVRLLNETGEMISMLPEPYKLALQALKDQSVAATSRFASVNAGKNELADAQRRMALVDAECKHIVQTIMRSPDLSLTIPTISEERLCVELGFGGFDCYPAYLHASNTGEK